MAKSKEQLAKEAVEALQAARQEAAEKCSAEVNAVLVKYNAIIVPDVVLRGNAIIWNVSIQIKEQA